MIRPIALFLFFVLGTSTLLAQKFGDGNPVWDYGIKSLWGGLQFHGHLTVEKDTLFQGKSCKVLIGSVANYMPVGNIVCSDSNKVFFWSTQRQAFQKMYDFSAKKGDNWTVWLDGYTTLDSNHITVDSVFTVSLNGFNLRAYTFRVLNPFNSGKTSYGTIHYSHPLTAIEYLGCTQAMFPWDCRGLDCDYTANLRCFEDDRIGHYKRKGGACDYTEVSIEQQSSAKMELNLFPNPNSGQFKINSRQQVAATYQLFDLRGNEVVIAIKQTGSLTEIILKKPVSGIYVLVTSSGNAETTRQKVVVE